MRGYQISGGVKQAVAILAFCVMAASSQAYLTSWGPAVVSDAVDSGSYDDIVNLYYNQDASYYYFAMELAAPVANAANGWNYYLYFNTDNDNGTGTQPAENSLLIPDTYLGIGIDTLVDQRYTAGVNQAYPTGEHLHEYDGTPPAYMDVSDYGAAGGLFQDTESGGTLLEWGIPIAMLGTGPMTVYGAVHSHEAIESTADDTVGFSFLYSSVAAPEPGTLALAGAIGLVVVVLGSRRRCGRVAG